VTAREGAGLLERVNPKSNSVEFPNPFAALRARTLQVLHEVFSMSEATKQSETEGFLVCHVSGPNLPEHLNRRPVTRQRTPVAAIGAGYELYGVFQVRSASGEPMAGDVDWYRCVWRREGAVARSGCPMSAFPPFPGRTLAILSIIAWAVTLALLGGR
jgi:hypothetical protein